MSKQLMNDPNRYNVLIYNNTYNNNTTVILYDDYDVIEFNCNNIN